VVEVAVHAILRDMVGRRERFSVGLEAGNTIGNLLGSIGLAENEIGLVVVDGCSVDLDHRLSDGAEVDVFPPFYGG